MKKAMLFWVIIYSLTVLMVLTGCTKQQDIIEPETTELSKPIPDTVNVKYVNVNIDANNEYYMFKIDFDKELQHKGLVMLSWTTLYNGKAYDHTHIFNIDKHQSQTYVTNVHVEWPHNEFGQIMRSTRSPIDDIVAGHTYFVY